MSKTYKKLKQNVNLAIANNFWLSSEFNCIDVGGFYATPSNREPVCHPLETVIIGKEITDYINFQICKNLNITIFYLFGFMDGYANSDYNKKIKRNDYLIGYYDGKNMSNYIINIE